MAFGFDFSRAEQDSYGTNKSSSYTGLGPEKKPWASQFYADVLERRTPQFESLLTAPSPTFAYAPNMPTGGLFPEQQRGLQEFGQQLFSNLSGGSARAGFVNPENTNAVLGASFERALPTVLNQIQQNRQLALQQEQDRLASLMMPEQVRQARTADFLRYLSLGPGFLGSSSTSEGMNWSSGGSVGGGASTKP